MDSGALDILGAVTGGTNIKVGYFSRALTDASGTQAITGIGSKPKAIIIFAGTSSASKVCHGYSDGTNEVCMYYHGSDSVWNVFTSDCIRIHQASGHYYDGTIQSFDSDGFTVSWTKNGSPTGTTTLGYIIIG